MTIKTSEAYFALWRIFNILSDTDNKLKTADAQMSVDDNGVK
ncbi:MAG: hypothetical protein RSE55_09625 [Lachnospiraceae bacterium]